MTEQFTVTSTDADTGLRLDRFLTACLSLSRSRIQALIESGMLTQNGHITRDAAHKVKPGETYLLTVPAPEKLDVKATEMALSIAYEDDHLIVIDKPAGLTVHPAPGHRDDTLVNALLAHCADTLSGIGGVERPGIVHRLDKDTSGLLIVAKNDEAHQHLSAQLADRSLKRTYHAIVWGTPVPSTGTITGNIARSHKNRQKMAVVKTSGRDATTHYKLLETFQIASLVECQLKTGRTHQIRVHMTHKGHGLVGDPTYGRPPKSAPEPLRDFPRQALHAHKISFIHPASDEVMEFESPLPDDMEQLLSFLSASKKQ